MADYKQILFEYEGEEQTGVLIKETSKEYIIKLYSGYNIVVDKEDVTIKKEEVLTKKEREENKLDDESENLPTIALLHTGGTIASRVDYKTGAVTAQFSEQEIKKMFPELSSRARIDSVFVGNMQSEMMRFSHWNTIIQAVKQAVEENVKGVIVTHGTDTMHYTAAALSFALQGINIPVILVGSQRSSDRPSSDAASNLLCATEFILQSDFSGVAICMHESIEEDNCLIIPGVNAKKMHTSRRDAFKAINNTPYARVHHPSLKVEQLKEYPKQQAELEISNYKEDLRIGLLYAHPQMYTQEVLAYKDFDGLVLGLFGIGHMPTSSAGDDGGEHENLLQAIQDLAEKIPVVGTPQTVYGRVDMNVYSPGRDLIRAGVLGQGLSMTTETAFVKLAWLLSNKKKEAIQEFYSKNIVGETSDRLEKQAFE